MLAAATGLAMAFESTIGPLGVVVFGILSRAFITANSAMFIAAPELYATRTRTLGVNIAFVLNRLAPRPPRCG